MRTLIRILTVVLCVLGTSSVVNAGAGVTYYGRLLKPNGSPVNSSSVRFHLQIRTPGSENCLLYQETQTLDLSSSDGIFALTLNDGTATVVNTEPFTIDRAFQNRGTFTFAAGKCAVGTAYSPNSADGRKIAVEFDDGSGAGFEPLPAQFINFVPMAMESMTVGGYGSGSMLRVNDGTGAPASISALTQTQYTSLMDLIAGTSASFLNSSSALNGANLSAGSIGDSALASGISASKISGNISGNSAGFTGSLAGDVTGTQSATSVVKLRGRDIDTTPPSNGQVLKWNSTSSRWEPSADNTGASGTVMSVTGAAGSAITVTGTSADPVVGIADASTSAKGVVQLATSGQNAANVVVQGNDSRLSDSRAPNGSASGDLSGSYPSPSVVKIQGKDIATTAPANGQVLTWNNATSKWEPATPTTGTVTSVAASAPLASSGGATPNITITKADTSTNGYLSSTDWNTFNGKQNALGFTPVNKAGDTMSGSLVVPANGLTVGTNQLVASGGFIGIGTTSPVAALHVEGGQGLFGTSTTRVVVGGGMVAGEKGIRVSWDVSSDAGKIQPEHQGTAYKNLLLNPSGGNVGVGTTAPNALLDVNGTMRVSQICDSSGANCKTVSGGWGAGGSVTSVSGTSGLTGTVTTSGSLSLANIANNNLLANTSGSAGTPVATTLSGLIDSALTGSAQGNILYRGASGWAVLAPGTSGQVLKTQGASANPIWANGNAGTVTSVDLSVPSILSVSGGPVTSSGTLAVSLANQATNVVFAGPASGGAAAPTFRSLNINDIRSTNTGTFLTGSTCSAGQALVYSSVSDTISCSTISLTSSQVTTALGAASTSTNGYLTSTDWNTFNGKQAALGFTPVNKAGDTMSGTLNLPSNGLVVGTSQLVANSGNIGIGTATPGQKLSVAGVIESTTGGIKFPDGTTQTTAAGSLTTLSPNSSAPVTCNAGNDGKLALTSLYTTCVCRNGTGWVGTNDGRSSCNWNTNVIVTNGATRSWSDGSYASSCNGYRNPTGQYAYSGSTGDGVYRIQVSGVVSDVNCDMTTDGGGYTLVAQNALVSDDLQVAASVGTYSSSYFKLSTANINTILASSSYWLIKGTTSGKRVKVNATLTAANAYAKLTTVIVGNGTGGCGATSWDATNYIDMDAAGAKCWAYPTSTGWYDMAANGYGGNGTGVYIYLK